MTKSFSAETALTYQRKEKLLHNISVYFIYKRKQDHLSGIDHHHHDGLSRASRLRFQSLRSFMHAGSSAEVVAPVSSCRMFRKVVAGLPGFRQSWFGSQFSSGIELNFFTLITETDKGEQLLMWQNTSLKYMKRQTSM